MIQLLADTLQQYLFKVWHFIYLNRGPIVHITKLYLIPLVTGVTLCQSLLSITTTDPCPENGFSTLSPSKISKSPPSKSFGSDNKITVDNQNTIEDLYIWKIIDEPNNWGIDPQPVQNLQNDEKDPN